MYRTWYPNKGDTSFHSGRVHLSPLICNVNQGMHCKTTYLLQFKLVKNLARYPNEANTSCHSFSMHVIPLMITLCMTMCSRICQFLKWSNYVFLLTHYPNIIDKSCRNVRVHMRQCI